jgi:hypothetical protein
MSQQSDMADAVYSRLSTSPVAAAQLVRELRSRWGAEHGVGSVHGFVREVATDLLHHDDVEVGDLRGGQFVSWLLPAWDADERIDAELMAWTGFLTMKVSMFSERDQRPNEECLVSRPRIFHFRLPLLRELNRNFVALHHEGAGAGAVDDIFDFRLHTGGGEVLRPSGLCTICGPQKSHYLAAPCARAQISCSLASMSGRYCFISSGNQRLLGSR